MRDTVIQKLLDSRLVTIVRGGYGTDCVKLAEALSAGGIQLLEVTYDQANPDMWQQTEETIRMLNRTLHHRMIFGAGTVTTTELVTRAKNAGAAFVVSPDSNPQVISAAVEAGLVAIPGAMTPTEVLQAHRAGADFVKLFPAGSLGVDYLKALAAPLNHVRLLAVGGINEQNVKAFREAGALGAGVGGNLVNRQWIREGKFDQITALAKQYVEAVK